MSSRLGRASARQRTAAPEARWARLSEFWADYRQSKVALVALGVILRGSTDHADLIGSTITQALMRLALEFTTPVIHEVLLLNDEKQAFARCIASQLNRGREAARTAARMAELFLNSLSRQ